ncbi:hypothetical protein GCM10023212_25700 [Luteolibacter yonseiensis]
MDHPCSDGNIWPDDLFKQVIETAGAREVEAMVNGTSRKFAITFEEELTKVHTWKIAGIRINPASAGTSPQVLEKIGQIPGIRLIAQPVTVKDGRVVVHDYAAHVVFNFLKPDARGKIQPPFQADDAALDAIVADLKEIRDLVSAGAATRGVPLDVHPGFVKKIPGFQSRLQAFLMKHLNRRRFQVVSFMGIKPPEPWIFFSVARAPDTAFGPRAVGGFAPPLQEGGAAPVLAQMFIALPGADHKVVPAPSADPATGFGISTALLFEKGIEAKLGHPLFAQGSAGPFSEARIRDVPDIIANPRFQNTITTDCVSCHTDFSRKVELGIDDPSGRFAFKRPDGISGVNDKLLPGRSGKSPPGLPSWNVRNFGWFPDFFDGGKTLPTISRRAANEAAESAEFINKWIASRPAVPAEGND